MPSHACPPDVAAKILAGLVETEALRVALEWLESPSKVLVLQGGTGSGKSVAAGWLHEFHRARKATWLYAIGVDLPVMTWGKSIARATVSFCKNHGGGNLPRLSKAEARRTPPEFRDVLLAMARSAKARAA